MDNHMDNNPNGNRPDNNKGPGRQDPNKNHQSILALSLIHISEPTRRS